MHKIDKTVISETRYIAVFEILLSVLMQAVFLVTGKWDYTVLLGNVYSAVIAVLNFLFMGIGIQKSLGKDENTAKAVLASSQRIRMFLLFIAAMIGALLPVFNIIAVLLPLLFPRLAVAARPIADRNKTDKR